uniref:Uncharacterized protein n=1 Tax=Populus alba TaxID=43335 RepID=A0A4V6XVT4_POPAL|nr:uncharacterized protein D5086_0000310550 [Populus alba]
MTTTNNLQQQQHSPSHERPILLKAESSQGSVECFDSYLSTSPQIFPSASQPAFWQQFICSCIWSKPIVSTNATVRIYVPAQRLRESKNIILQVLSQLRVFAENLFTFLDSSGNTMLHLAAKLSPPSQLSRISGAALQMQRELQWYKEVESIITLQTRILLM